ncbi:MAG: ATP-dependent DNA helicase [Herminiimonas sp.]|nr:ATP-dependent DNA helicase [Herminiimonas sp.]
MNYTVAVRSLCEFTAKVGDLDLRFTPSPTAQEGIAGHKVVAARRPAHYESEVSLSGAWQTLLVRGRADGYDPHANRLEEIKTFRGDLARMPDNHRQLHWAQAKIYGWLLCQARGLAELTVALVYFDIASQEETVIQTMWTAGELQAFFEQQCGRFLAWAQQELAHRSRRDEALRILTFPHGSFRTGQRPLSEAVYKAAASARCLMAQAPTGIGKTIGTIFPVLKAMPGQQLDKVFFLTAKTSGRRVALDSLALLDSATQAQPMRVIELVARANACEFPENACHGDACPLAKGFYDRLPMARQAALDGAGGAGSTQTALLDQASVRTVALAHDICPYYLGQELVRWTDVAVADYNYYFDYSAMLHGLTVANEWRVALLIDEAHNLVERARAMYSASLDQAHLRQVRRTAPAALKTPLQRLQRSWTGLPPTGAAGAALPAYSVHATIPASFQTTLQQALAAIGEFLAEHPAETAPALLDFYFDALHFSRLVDSFGKHSLFDISTAPADDGRRAGTILRTLAIRNAVPAPFLKGRFASAHTATLFSATLSPEQFYRDTLGLPENAVWTDVPSPFVADQLAVRVVDSISTRYAHRRESLLPIVELIARQHDETPGNYLAFFSSFDYLQQVAELFRQRHPGIAVWEQARRMDQAARTAFLDRFVAGGCGIGFAVLGGSFGEGIDLPGDRLIGAFIATLGLPQVNPVNEQMMQKMEDIFAAGYDYTYLYPGIRKVVQAAGRVIRTQADRGVVYLIDDRFLRPQIQRLLPGWWVVQRAAAGDQRASATLSDLLTS